MANGKNTVLSMKDADAELTKLGKLFKTSSDTASTAEADFFTLVTDYAHRGVYTSIGDESKISDHIVDLWIAAGNKLSADSRKTKRSEYMAAVKLGTNPTVASSGIAAMEKAQKIWEKTPSESRAKIYRVKLAVARQSVKTGTAPAQKDIDELVAKAPQTEAEKNAAKPGRAKSLVAQLKVLVGELKITTNEVASALAVLELAVNKKIAAKPARATTTKKAA